jgi:hypothetical protein
MLCSSSLVIFHALHRPQVPGPIHLCMVVAEHLFSKANQLTDTRDHKKVMVIALPGGLKAEVVGLTIPHLSTRQLMHLQ